MLSPKKVKWRKVQKGRIRGYARSGATLFYGDYGLQALTAGLITSRQLEAARVAMTRFIKRGGDVWVRIFPNKPITKKAAETRMGSGKGNVEEWAAVIHRGRILFEMAGITREEGLEALRLAGHKLPLKCKVISKTIHASQMKKADAERAAKEAAAVAKGHTQTV